MGKIRINKIISMVILFATCFLAMSFCGCRKDEYPFELSEDAQVYTFDSNNLMKLSEIIVEKDRLIYKFEKNGNVMTPEKILELTNDKGQKIVMLGENIGYREPFERVEIVEKGKQYYIVLYYILDSYTDPLLSGFMINSSERYESFYIKQYSEPFLCFDDSYYNSIIYLQEYNKESNSWTEVSYINCDTAVD